VSADATNVIEGESALGRTLTSLGTRPPALVTGGVRDLAAPRRSPPGGRRWEGNGPNVQVQAQMSHLGWR
jgi:hypothetical protein